jgi:hypothetical protein
MTDDSRPCNDPLCFRHDPHWHDDYAYASSSVHGTTPKSYPIEKALRLLTDFFANNKPDTGVMRFSFIYVDESGHLDIISNPGSDMYSTTNLLARTISLLAIQHEIQESMDLPDTLSDIFREELRKEMEKTTYDEAEHPGPPVHGFTEPTPYPGTDDTDPHTGQYL